MKSISIFVALILSTVLTSVVVAEDRLQIEPEDYRAIDILIEREPLGKKRTRLVKLSLNIHRFFVDADDMKLIDELIQYQENLPLRGVVIDEELENNIHGVLTAMRLRIQVSQERNRASKDKRTNLNIAFDVSNNCGSRFNHSVGLTNGTPEQVRDAGERSDMAFNAVIGWQSWGCHVRPERVVILQERRPCYTTRRTCCENPTVYPYGSRYTDTRNRVVVLPPGTPNPGCSCPGHRPGEPCHCGPHCRQCQGACSAH